MSATAIPAVTKISSRITRILGCNPGPMTLQGTNTYILGTGKKRILLDTGDANIPEYLNHLGSVLKKENISLSHIFISHWHHDHIGGLSDVLSLFKEHTGEGTAVFEDLYDYMKSLNLILDIQPSIIYPGHGNIISDPVDRIKYYISHRQQRENQIMDVLQNSKNKTFSEEDLVLAIYVGLAENLIIPAQKNVNHHLQKLLKEGRVKQVGELWQYSEEELQNKL